MTRTAALVLALTVSLPGQAPACRLELLSALDVSAWLGERRHLLQQKGSAPALPITELATAFTRTRVSGDGHAEDGFQPLPGYHRSRLNGVKVNVPAIGDSAAPDGLVCTSHWRVVRGPNAFVQTVADYGNSKCAVRKKSELNTLAVGVLL